MVWTIFVGENSWRQLSLIGDETVMNLQRTKVYVFSDSATEIMTVSMESRRIRVEHLPRIHNVAALR